MYKSVYSQKRKLIEEKQVILMKLAKISKEEEYLEEMLTEINNKIKEFNNAANKALKKMKGKNALITVFLGRLDGLKLRQIAEKEQLSYDYVRELNTQINHIFGDFGY